MKQATGELVKTDTMKLRGMKSAYCLLCDNLVNLLTEAEAAETFQMSAEEITSLLDSGSIHRLHNRKAELMLCRVSMFAYFEACKTLTFNLEMLEGPAASQAAGRA
jgi:hypothetical protein